ncbi:SDR family oxidoreductase, partial [Streptomyces sp. SID10244]|nr:SDR family oxidoreductase [Streptomyces sp. SID10244]
DLNLDAAKQTADSNPKIVPMSVDVADRATVDALRDAVDAEVGVPDILVNAAGWDRTDQFLNATTEFAEKVVAI